MKSLVEIAREKLKEKQKQTGKSYLGLSDGKRKALDWPLEKEIIRSYPSGITTGDIDRIIHGGKILFVEPGHFTRVQRSRYGIIGDEVLRYIGIMDQEGLNKVREHLEYLLENKSVHPSTAFIATSNSFYKDKFDVWGISDLLISLSSARENVGWHKEGNQPFQEANQSFVQLQKEYIRLLGDMLALEITTKDNYDFKLGNIGSDGKKVYYMDSDLYVMHTGDKVEVPGPDKVRRYVYNIVWFELYDYKQFGRAIGDEQVQYLYECLANVLLEKLDSTVLERLLDITLHVEKPVYDIVKSKIQKN